MPFIQTSFPQSQSASSKTITVCVQYVAVSCCLSAKQMATSKQCKVPIMMMCVSLPLEKNLVWSTLTGRKEPGSKRPSLSSEKYLIEVTSPKYFPTAPIPSELCGNGIGDAGAECAERLRWASAAHCPSTPARGYFWRPRHRLQTSWWLPRLSSASPITRRSFNKHRLVVRSSACIHEFVAVSC